MAAAVTGSRANENWVIQVAYDRTSLEAALKRHESMMAVVLAFVSLAALGLGHLDRSKGAPATAGNGGCDPANPEFHTSASACHLKDPAPELASLAESFNEMLDRLDKSFMHISKFSADIAHELRTPLTNLRGEAEVALSKERPAEHYREVLVSSLEEYAHISGDHRQAVVPGPRREIGGVSGAEISRRRRGTGVRSRAFSSRLPRK